MNPNDFDFSLTPADIKDARMDQIAKAEAVAAMRAASGMSDAGWDRLREDLAAMREETCPCCSARSFRAPTGEWACQNCGASASTEQIDADWYRREWERCDSLLRRVQTSRQGQDALLIATSGAVRRALAWDGPAAVVLILLGAAIGGCIALAVLR